MDDDDDETKDKQVLNFGVPKNIKKKPILIPAKGEYKFKGSANNKVKNDQGVTVVKEHFLTEVDDQEAWEKLMEMRVNSPIVHIKYKVCTLPCILSGRLGCCGRFLQLVRTLFRHDLLFEKNQS